MGVSCCAAYTVREHKFVNRFNCKLCNFLCLQLKQPVVCYPPKGVICMKTTTNNHTYILGLVYCALFAALIAICSWISIPTTIPFTLQTFAVCVTTALLGTKRGFTAVLVYILLGLVGMPVFSGFTGGIGVLAGVTGGYIIGFLFTALAVGLITAKFGKSIPILALAMAVGILICYAFGTAWFMVVYARSTGPVGLMSALSWCVFPYLLPDAVKIVLAIIVVNRMEKYVKL